MSYPFNSWMMNECVGGPGGGVFSMVAKKGIFIKSIRVYVFWVKQDIYWIMGLAVTWSDGTTSTQGRIDDSKDTRHELKFNHTAALEKITEMSLWGMGKGKWDRTSKILIKTNKQTLEAGNPAKGQNEYKMDVGSGILVGFQGASGDGIDRLVPVFLKPIVKQHIDKINYPTLDMNNMDFLEMETLDRDQAVWRGTSYKFVFQGEKQKVITTTWNQKLTLDTTVKVKWSAGLPLIGGAETEWSLSIGGQFDRGGSETDTKILRWTFEKTLESEEDQVECLATYYSGNMDLDYTGRYNVQLEDGTKFSFDTSGTLQHVVVSAVRQSVKPLYSDRDIDGEEEVQFFAPESLEGESSEENRSYEEEEPEYEPEEEDRELEEQFLENVQQDGEAYQDENREYDGGYEEERGEEKTAEEQYDQQEPSQEGYGERDFVQGEGVQESYGRSANIEPTETYEEPRYGDEQYNEPRYDQADESYAEQQYEEPQYQQSSDEQQSYEQSNFDNQGYRAPEGYGSEAYNDTAKNPYYSEVQEVTEDDEGYGNAGYQQELAYRRRGGTQDEYTY